MLDRLAAFITLALLPAMITPVQAGWTQRFDQAQAPSTYLYSENSPVAIGTTVHSLWPLARSGADLRGFDQFGNAIYAIDTVSPPFNAPAITRLQRVGSSTGPGALIAAGGNVMLKVSGSGSLVWRLEGIWLNPDDEIVDAFEYPGGSTAIAIRIGNTPSLLQVNAAGNVTGTRTGVAVFGFDSNGHLLALSDQQVLVRIDGQTLENVPPFTPIGEPPRSVATARDDGAVVLTATGLIRVDATGAVRWKAPFVGVAVNSGSRYRLLETASGSWLVYEYGAIQSRLTGVSASGSVLYSRATGNLEAETVSSDGRLFLADGYQPHLLDAATGSSTPLDPALSFFRISRAAAMPYGWVFAPLDDTPGILAVSNNGTQLWSKRNLRVRAQSFTPSPERQPLCFGPAAVATSEGFAAMSLAGIPGDVGSPPAASMQFVSSAGALLASAPVASKHCMPALDPSMTRYEADAATTSVRAIRRDGSIAWATALPMLSFYGTLATANVNATVVAARLGNAVVGLDRASGALLWTRYITGDASTPATDAVWVVANGALTRIAPDGGTLTAAGTPHSAGTGGYLMRGTADGGLITADFQSVQRYNANGSVRWQTTITAGNVSASLVRAANEMANGETVVAGCDLTGFWGYVGFYARLSSNGAVLHRRTFTAGGATCIDAIAEQASGELVIGLRGDKGSSLRLFSATGDELSRYDQLWPDMPQLSMSDLIVQGSTVISFGSAGSLATGLLQAALVTSDNIAPASSRLRFVSGPPATVRYDQPFAITVGLANVAGTAVNATSALLVRVGPASSSGAQASSGTCTIAAGSSQCTISGLRARPVTIQVPLSPPQTVSVGALLAAADSKLPVQSTDFTAAAAPTTVTLTVLTPAPRLILSEIRYHVVVNASISPGITDVALAPSGCIAVPAATAVAQYECRKRLTAAATTLSFSYSGSTGAYASSSGTLQVQAQKTSLQIRPLASNPTQVRAGEYFVVGADLLLPDGQRAIDGNFTPVLRNSVSTVLCPDMPVAARYATPPALQRACRTREPRAGNEPLQLSVAETDQVLAASAALPLLVTPALGIEGTISIDNNAARPTLCGTSPGLNCTLSAIATGGVSFACSAPQDWQGRLFVQAPGVRFPGNGRAFGPIRAIEPDVHVGEPRATTACSLDVNGDSSIDIENEAVFVLRNLFGIATPASYETLNHACAERDFDEAQAYIAAAKANLDWDLDGDGEVLPLTDGLMILRLMLGQYDTRFIAGAVNPAGTRSNASDIVNYFFSRCGSPSVQ